MTVDSSLNEARGKEQKYGKVEGGVYVHVRYKPFFLHDGVLGPSHYEICPEVLPWVILECW